MYSMRGNDDERLDALFQAYRDACPDPEASANFMPTLWSRIDSRQTFLFSFRRMANANPLETPDIVGPVPLDLTGR